jgi:homoserine kinase type II
MDHFPQDTPRLEEISETIERRFGFRVHSAEPIERGWLNRKWKLKTDHGVMFAKQYHPDRYRLHEPEKLKEALIRQNRLRSQGIPCPLIHTLDGEPLIATPSGIRFVLTEFCSGELVEPGRANAEQMGDLGRVTGRMHALLNRNARLPKRADWEPEPPAAMLEKWRSNWNAAQGKPCPDGLMEALDIQRRIIESFDAAVFATCVKGWTHWDLWVDNLLFHPAKVAAILDFDRMRVLYPELDIARALLSCALDVESGAMEPELADRFLEGYRSAHPFPRGGLARAFKLLWWLEATKWMVHDMDKYSAPPARFARENIWLTRNWNELEDRFGEL